MVSGLIWRRCVKRRPSILSNSRPLRRRDVLGVIYRQEKQIAARRFLFSLIGAISHRTGKASGNSGKR